MLMKKWLAVMLAMCVSALVAPMCAQAEELADLPKPVNLETIVPSDTKIPEQLAYGAMNRIDLDKIEISEGGDYWTIWRINDHFCRLVPKESYVGAFKRENFPICKIKIPNLITDFEDEELDCYLSLSLTALKTTVCDAYDSEEYYFDMLNIDSTARRISMGASCYLEDGLVNTGLVFAGAKIHCNVSYKYAGTDNTYVSNYPAAWIYSDIDQPSRLYKDSKVSQEFLTDFDSGDFFNESFLFGKGNIKSFIADSNKLYTSKSNRLFCSCDSSYDVSGKDSYDVAGVVMVSNAGEFEFDFAVSANARSSILDSANYYTGMKLVKKSSVTNFTKTCKNAVYGLYDDEQCTFLNRRLTIGDDGTVKSAGTLDLDSKKYYLKELAAPEGYKLDSKVHEVDLSSSLGKWMEVVLTDEPLNYEGNTKVTNGTISDSYVADYGSTKTIVYSPDEGYHLVKVVVDGEEVDIEKYPDSYTFEDIKADHEIHVVYEIDKFDLDTSVEGGTITEGGEADYGSNKTIEYFPNEGYHIVSVTVDDEEVDIEQYPDSYTFEDIKEDHKIHVVYEIDKFVIKTYVENGTITESSTVAWGESKLVEYEPKEGYHLESVVVDDEELAEDISTDSHEFANVAADHEVKVVYAIDKKETVIEEDDNNDAGSDEVAAVSTPSKTETTAAEAQTTSAKKASLPSTGDGCVMLIVAAVIVAFCSFATLIRRSA